MNKINIILEQSKQDTPKKMDSLIKKVTNYLQIMQDKTVLDTMPPDSFDVYAKTLKEQQKETFNKMSMENKSKYIK